MWFLFSKFKAKKWLKYSYEKRFKIFVALEKKVAKQLKIEPLILELHEEEEWNCFGAFTVNNGLKKIVLNQNLIYEPRFRFHAMETIAHETRHAYQYGIISKDLKWYEFTAKKWKRKSDSFCKQFFECDYFDFVCSLNFRNTICSSNCKFYCSGARYTNYGAHNWLK